MTKNIQLITDAAADLTLEEIKKYNIEVVNFSLTKNNETEEFSPTTDELYQLMAENPTMTFKTACPSIDSFQTLFEKYAKQGTEVICITITTGQSGSYGSAIIAKKNTLEIYPDAKITVIDSLMNTVLQGLLVTNVQEMLSNGLTTEQIVAKVDEMKKTARIFFTVGDLSYLISGGRISSLKSLVIKTLNIKPIIVLRDGDIISGGLGLGLKSTLQKVISLGKSWFPKHEENISDYYFCVGYSHDVTLGTKLIGDCKNALGIAEEDIKLRRIGCTAAVHLGPQTIGFAFIKKPSSINL